MRCVVQRVSEASVTVDGIVIARIDHGLLVLVGVQEGDQKADVEWTARKVASLRIFPDDEGLMNRSVGDVKGELLVVSQFTLLASTRKGSRPSFNEAAKPLVATALYEDLLKLLAVLSSRPVRAGKFGADMKVSLVNNGPVTLVLNSKTRE